MSFFSRDRGGMIGIDISSTGIKLVELSRHRSGYEVTAFSFVDLPQGAIVENAIADEVAISDALKRAVQQANPSTTQAALAVSGNAVIIKTITMPVMSELELEGQIEFEADQYVPYDIEDVSLDFYIQGLSLDDPEQMDVVLVACKRELIEGYQQVLAAAGLHAACIDCAVFALENAAELAGVLTPPDDPEQSLPDEGVEACALVNIGANMMNINILIEGRMAFVRDQFYGGQQLTEAIEREHGISGAAAEQLKLENFSAIQPAALEAFYQGLTSELLRSLDYYAASRSDHPVGQLYLSGGCALLPGIADELQRRLGISIALLNPLEKVSFPTSQMGAAQLKQRGTLMAVPLGLALRKFDA